MKVTELRNQSISVDHQAAENGTPEFWRLVFTDKDSGEVIFCSFGAELKRELIRLLMGGGVVVPQMVIPKGRPHK